jgi:hypothetical protein
VFLPEKTALTLTANIITKDDRITALLCPLDKYFRSNFAVVFSIIINIITAAKRNQSGKILALRVMF